MKDEAVLYKFNYKLFITHGFPLVFMKLRKHQKRRRKCFPAVHADCQQLG